MPSLLQKACQELGIDVPVMRVDQGKDGILVLHLYGHDIPVVYHPQLAKVLFPDDLTAITGVGGVTAQALHKAGFHTYKDLINASDVVLLDVVRPSALTRIRKYLKEHYD